jgi:hypothetical protein
MRLVMCEVQTVAHGEEKFLNVSNINWPGKHSEVRQNR